MLLKRLGIRLPIIQAPMAGVSTPAMAAAVSDAGGLGSVSVGATDALGARAVVEAVRALTARPFNVNVFCHQPAVAMPAVEAAWIERFRPVFARFGAAPPAALHEIYRSFVDDAAMLALFLELLPPVVSFHFGLPPRASIMALRDAGTVLLATATNVAEADAIVAAGIDAIVAQGWEAGGHRGVFDPAVDDPALPTLRLVEVIRQHHDIPVIAAGGIMSGADIATALRAGADAVQMGTAFVATPESQADRAYRAALASEAAGQTLVTRALSGRPARSLPTAFTALTHDVAPGEVPAYPLAYDLGKALHAAARAKGESGFGAQWAGTGAASARALPTAALMAALEAELADALASGTRG